MNPPLIETNKPTLAAPFVEKAVQAALMEDLGQGGDITTNSIFSVDDRGKATLRARAAGILAGSAFANEAFKQLDPSARCNWLKRDGDALQPGEKLATISATIPALLTGERTALNFLGHLSGIASLTGQYVRQVEGTGAVIIDTRKTTPGLRFAEKYAVRMGGGQNHRFRLDDAILIKDNHIAFAGGLSAAVKKARRAAGHMVKLEVEVDTLDQLKEAIEAKVDAVLIDNFNIEQLGKAVALAKGHCITEASGGVTLNTVRKIAETGVELISVGALTHSAPCLDLGLDIDIGDA